MACSAYLYFSQPEKKSLKILSNVIRRDVIYQHLLRQENLYRLVVIGSSINIAVELLLNKYFVDLLSLYTIVRQKQQNKKYGYL